MPYHPLAIKGSFYALKPLKVLASWIHDIKAVDDGFLCHHVNNFSITTILQIYLTHFRLMWQLVKLSQNLNHMNEEICVDYKKKMGLDRFMDKEQFTIVHRQK